MAADVLLILAGLALAGLTLVDVFQTVIAPGGSRASLRVTKRIVAVLLPLWKRVRPHRGVSGMFAPVALLASFVTWVVLLIVAFGAIAFAVRTSFHPSLQGFSDAVYFAGSSVVTIGLSETDATGPARWVVLAAGLCGLGVITLAVTYLLLVLNSVAQRDSGILKLNTTAGEPPCALTLLETVAALRCKDELPAILRGARDWCVTVRQSHATHPSLLYFQSIGAGSGWPAALGALLDLALYAELLVDDERLYGLALLLRKDAVKMAGDLAKLAGLQPKMEQSAPALLQEVTTRLDHAGYPLRHPIDLPGVATARDHLQACVAAMADHLGKPTTALVP
jgi:hypothetical protein